MAIIKKYNAKNDTTYVYDSVSYWDKDLKQPRSRRKLIGKIDPATGEVVPTAGRGRKTKKTDPVPEKKPPITSSEDNYGRVDSEKINPDMSESDIRLLYEECRRSLLETEAALAKSESTVRQLTREKQELRTELESLVRRLSS